MGDYAIAPGSCVWKNERTLAMLLKLRDLRGA